MTTIEDAIERANAAPVPMRFEAFGRLFVIHLPAHLGAGTATGAYYANLLATRIRRDFILESAPSGLLAGSYRWAVLDPEPYKNINGPERSEDGDPAGYDFDANFLFDPRDGYSQEWRDYA